VTCTVHLTLLDLIILIILVKECKLWSSSVYSFLQPPVTLSLFGPNIVLSTVFSNTIQYLLPPQRPSFTPIQNQRKNYILVYFSFYVFR
jgi:hypothetical protein